MLFKGSVKKKASKLFWEVSDMTARLTTEPELTAKNPDLSSIIFSAYLFMVAGFLGKGKISEEMFPIYQRFLVEKGASKEAFDLLSSYVQKYYSEIRRTMIEAQDKLGNNVDALLFALSDTVCELAQVEDRFIGVGIVKEYITIYLERASKIV